MGALWGQGQGGGWGFLGVPEGLDGVSCDMAVVFRRPVATLCQSAAVFFYLAAVFTRVTAMFFGLAVMLCQASVMFFRLAVMLCQVAAMFLRLDMTLCHPAMMVGCLAVYPCRLAAKSWSCRRTWAAQPRGAEGTELERGKVG